MKNYIYMYINNKNKPSFTYKSHHENEYLVAITKEGSKEECDKRSKEIINEIKSDLRHEKISIKDLM